MFLNTEAELNDNSLGCGAIMENSYFTLGTKSLRPHCKSGGFVVVVVVVSFETGNKQKVLEVWKK